MTQQTTYYPFKAEVPITRLKSLAEFETISTQVKHLLDVVNEIVEWKEHEFSMRIAHGIITFWFKQERHAILTILRCS